MLWKIKNWFLHIKRIRYVKIILRRLVIPGFDGVPLLFVLNFFIKGISNGSVTIRAAALSFNFFLSLFPTIIFFFTLIPYIPIDGFQDTLLHIIQNILPKDVSGGLNETLHEILLRQNGSLLSLGFIGAMIFSTSGIVAFMNAFNATYHSVENRTFIKKRFMALVLVLLLAVIVITTIVMLTGSSWLLKYFYLHNFYSGDSYYIILKLLRWLILVSMLFLAISCLYYLAPAKSDKFRFISAGSSLSTLLVVITSLGFNFYISHFSSYNKLYGSIGALIIFMLWIYINALVILLGFELNTSITQASRQKQNQ